MSHLQVDIVPSPNLYLPGIMDTSLQGQLAYGYRGKIIVFDIHSKPKLRLIYQAHEYKVSSVSFCKKNDTYILASAGEEGNLKVWDIRNNPMLISSASFEQKKINAVEFKYGVSNRVFCASGRFLKVYLVEFHQWKVIKTNAKEEILMLSSCPSNPSILLAGHKYGLVSVYNVETLKNICKLYGHSADITSVSWRPMSDKQMLSSSQDGTVRLWTISDEDITNVVCNDSPPKKESKFKRGVIAAFHVNDPNLFFFASHDGAVSLYDISEDEYKKYEFLKENGSHFRFVMLMVPNHCDPNVMITHSFDKQIIFWDLSSKMCIRQLFTLLSSIQSVDICPQDNIRLAIGCSDSSIRIWDTTGEHNAVKLTKGELKNKVTAVAWHPVKEETLAFSDEDGRVGILTASQQGFNKGLTFLARRHHGNVYCLCWGPCKLEDAGSEKSSNYFLYSCGGKKVYVHPIGNNAKPGISFENLIGSTEAKEDEVSVVKDKTAIAWKPDYSLFAIGTSCGSIEIYDTDFHLVATCVAKKRVSCIKWHPNFISLSPARCSMHCWFAVASQAHDVYLYDLIAITDSDVKAPVNIPDPARLLKGHRESVSEICWSPHVQGRLASASFDCTVQVWDVMSGQLLVSFNGHSSRVFTVKWSYLDPDLLFSGGDDCFMFRWRISEQNDERPTKKDKKKIMETMKQTPAVNVHEKSEQEENGEVDSADTSTAAAESDEKDEPDIPKDKFMETSVSYEEPVSERFPKMHTGERYPKKLCAFKVVCEALNCKKSVIIQDCMKFASVMSKAPQEDKFDEKQTYLGLFGQDVLFHRAFDAETKRSQNDHSCVSPSYFYMCNGRIKEYILEAMAKNELNDYLVSLSPLVSRAFWLEVCEKYAVQCATSKSYAKAVSYLLLCNKVYEAIDLLKNAGNFRDAVGLAKIRLHPSDPIIAEVQEKWAVQLTQESKHVPAAMCYIGLNQPLKAAEVVTRGDDSRCYHLAAYICHCFGEHDAAKKYIRKTVFLALINNQWQLAEDCMDIYPDFGVLKTVIQVHRMLVDVICDGKENNVSGFMTSQICSDEIAEKDEVLWKFCSVKEKYFLQYIYDSFFAEIDPISSVFNTATLEMENMYKESQCYKNTPMILMSLAFEITSFFFTVISCGDKSTVDIGKYLAAILFICFQGDAIFVETATQLFFPFNVVWNVEEKKIKLSSATSKEGGVIEDLVISLGDAVDCLNIFQTQQLLGNVDFIHNGEYYSDLDKIEPVISSASSVECVLGFFSTYLLYKLKEVLIKSGWSPICFEEPELPANDGCGVDPQEQSLSNGLAGQPHMRCSNSAQPFLQLCRVFTACVCKDVFAVKQFFTDSLAKVETALLYLRLEAKKAGHLHDKCIPDGDGENTENMPDEIDAEKGASENKEKIEELDKRFCRFTEIHKELKQRMQGMYVPDGIPAVLCIIDVISSTAEKASCPDVKQDLTSLGHQLKLWYKKFII